MILRKIIFSSAALAALVACSGKWNQDPLKDLDNSVRNGHYNPPKPEAPKPEVRPDAVVVDSAEIYSFKENETGKIQLKARVFKPDYKVFVQVDNLSDFPGATYDEATGVFEWTPARGFVSGPDTRDVVLNLTGVAVPQNGKDTANWIAPKAVKIIVYRTRSVPRIVSTDFNARMAQNQVREGGSYSFDVVIEDNDMLDVDPNTYPTLHVLAGDSGDRNLASFVVVKSQTKARTNQITYNLELDLTRVELTDSSSMGSFGLKVVSWLAVPGNVEKISTKIFTSLQKPISTLTNNEVLFPATEKTVYDFNIFDTRYEGVLSAKVSGAPIDARVICNAAIINKSFLSCSMTWTPTQEMLVGKSLRIDVTSNNKDSNDRQTVTESFSLKYKATPAPTTTTTMPPTTTTSLPSREAQKMAETRTMSATTTNTLANP